MPPGRTAAKMHMHFFIYRSHGGRHGRIQDQDLRMAHKMTSGESLWMWSKNWKNGWTRNSKNLRKRTRKHLGIRLRIVVSLVGRAPIRVRQGKATVEGFVMRSADTGGCCINSQHFHQFVTLGAEVFQTTEPMVVQGLSTGPCLSRTSNSDGHGIYNLDR